MPITKSAKKALRGSARKRAFNEQRKENFRQAVKAVKKALAAGQTESAKKLLAKAYQTIDKAAKGKTIKKNTAARKKSRLARLITKNQKTA